MQGANRVHGHRKGPDRFGAGRKLGAAPDWAEESLQQLTMIWSLAAAFLEAGHWHDQKEVLNPGV